MLVSHRHRFIYTKTVKTGGTSVESYFEPFCMNDGEWEPAHYRKEYVSPSGIVGFRGSGRPTDCIWWNHMPAAQIRDLLGEPIWSSYFKFCVVRNPYERVVSHFYFLRNEGLLQKEYSEPESMQFERWLVACRLPIDRDKYVIDGKLCMDAVVKYEDLHADLARICRRLALPWRPELLPQLKTGIRPAWASVEKMYTPRAEEIIRAAFAYELDQFGYSFAASESPSLQATP